MAIKAPEKPWDILIAQYFVKKIAKINLITPNFITFIRALVSMACIVTLTKSFFVSGSCLFAIANLLDHFDGELARFTGTKTKFGHWFDLATDAFTVVGFFIALGFGLSNIYGLLPLLGGLLSGSSILIIFVIRNKIEQNYGKKEVKQKAFCGFETEDILYFIPLLAITDTLVYFLILSAFGAPIGALLTFKDYKKK